MRLTDLSIRKLRAPDSGQKTYFDDALPGFGIRVSQGGTKSYVVMYGKQRRLKTLGRYPDMGLADARRAAKRVQSDVALLNAVGLTELPAISVENAIERFLADARTRLKPSTSDEYSRLLHRHFRLAKDLNEVARSDIVDILDSIKDAPSARQHAFVAIRTLMNWCFRHGLIKASPVPPLQLTAQARARVLTDNELRAVWNRAEGYGFPYGRMIQLLILTGQRRGEIAALRRRWIDSETITFPAGFTKNKREHSIPIGTCASRIIGRLPENTDLLFPARGSDERPFNGWSKSKRLFDRSIEVTDYTLHDLRRTFATKLAALGTPIHVTEKLLNHVSGTLSGVAAIYNRHSYMDEMREAIAAYESHLAKLIGE